MTSLDYVRMGLPQVGLFGSRRFVINSASILLNSNGGGNLDVPGFAGYTLYSVTPSSPAWVRIYSSNSARIADVASGRGKLEDPDASSGVIAEVLTNAISQTVDFNPAINGYVKDAAINGQIYIPIHVTNTNYDQRNISIQIILVQAENS
jgi:hypothetical protein